MAADPDWFGALVRALVAAGERSAVTGRVLAGAQEVRSGFVPALVESDEAAVYAGRLDRDVLAAGSMALWRAAIAELGDFDERLGAGSRFAAADDNDFGFRLLQAGYVIVYVPGAILYHRAWRPIREYLPIRWSYGRGKGGFYAKYIQRGDRHMLGRARRDVLRRVRNIPRHLVRVAPRAALGDLLYLAGVLSGAAEWIVTERRRR
jgi:GT2 family glycosyltransferase